MDIRVLTSTIGIVIAVMCTGTAQALDVGAGIKGGLNFATVSNADQAFPPTTAPPLTAGSVESPRFIGGVFVAVRFSDVLAFQPEGLYSMQGVKGIAANTTFSRNPTVAHSNAHIDMIQIPLLLRVGHEGGAYFIVGPEVGFVARAIQQTDGTPDSDFKNKLNSRDTSLVVGGGATLSRVLVEARYAAGLTDINKPAGNIINKNQAFSILAGFHF